MQPLWDRERRRKICERVGSWEHLFSTTPIYFHNYREQKKTDPSILELFFSRFLGVLETPNQWILEVAMTPISNFQVLITVNSVPESQIIQPYVGMSQEVMVNVPQQVAFEDEAQLVVDSLNLYIYIYCIYIQLYSPGVAVC